MSEQQWWQPPDMKNIAQLMKQCEVCYGHFSIDTIIPVNNIVFQNSRRITPYYICPECAQKVSDAFTEKTHK